VGRFYSPEEVSQKLTEIASARGYSKLRISGNEPTLGRQHLIALLEHVNESGYLFILETNGLLLGVDKSYAEELGSFTNLHVRVSLKGCNETQFTRITGAKPEVFGLQLKSLENLVEVGVSCHPAIMKEFTSERGLNELRSRLSHIDRKLAEELEFEFLITFPHVVQELHRRGIEIEPEGASRKILMNY
jgi:uncharacterized Fe-S cluster-containing radical SAM superfamily protein